MSVSYDLLTKKYLNKESNFWIILSNPILSRPVNEKIKSKGYTKTVPSLFIFDEDTIKVLVTVTWCLFFSQVLFSNIIEKQFWKVHQKSRKICLVEFILVDIKLVFAMFIICVIFQKFSEQSCLGNAFASFGFYYKGLYLLASVDLIRFSLVVPWM